MGEMETCGKDGGVAVNHDGDSDGTDAKEVPNRSPDTAEDRGPARWLYALNSFLESAFLEADRATGC